MVSLGERAPRVQESDFHSYLGWGVWTLLVLENVSPCSGHGGLHDTHDSGGRLGYSGQCLWFAEATLEMSAISYC